MDVATRELAPPLEHEPKRVGRDELLRSPRPTSAAAAPSSSATTTSSAPCTVRRPGLDAVVLRLRPSPRGLAVSLDGPGGPGLGSTRGGRGVRTVFEAASQRRLRGRTAAGDHRLPQLWQSGEARDRVGAHGGDRGDVPRVRGPRRPGRLRQRLALQRDGRRRSRRRLLAGCVGLVTDVRGCPARGARATSSSGRGR